MCYTAELKLLQPKCYLVVKKISDMIFFCLHIYWILIENEMFAHPLSDSVMMKLMSWACLSVCSDTCWHASGQWHFTGGHEKADEGMDIVVRWAPVLVRRFSFYPFLTSWNYYTPAASSILLLTVTKLKWCTLEPSQDSAVTRSNLELPDSKTAWSHSGQNFGVILEQNIHPPCGHDKCSSWHYAAT